MAGEFSASNPRYTASVAVYRNRPSEKFKSRSALARFSDVIDKFARERHGHLWECPISDTGPMRLPKTREQATDIEQHYAYSLLKMENPGLEFPEIIDLNDSVPSFLRRECPELDIDADFWKKAISLADQAYERQLTLFDELRDTLEHFATLAYNENIKCMAYNENTHAKQNIDARFWEVDEDALVARYYSNSIAIPEDGNNVQYLILVDTNSFSPSKLLITPDYAQRELIVRERLREAKTISENIPPHGTIGKLRSIICNHLACDPQQAVAIINAETGGCWSKRGSKKEYDKIHVKQIEIVLKDDL